MNYQRTSGILLHITSLPGGYGVGDFGASAYRFVDTLGRMGQGLWQVLPLGPPGYGNSPYQCYSAFAGNPLLVSLDRLADEGLLKPDELDSAELMPADTVDFDRVIPFHSAMLRTAFRRFQVERVLLHANELQLFARRHAYWLDDYTLFQALKTAHDGKAWTEWDPAVRSRDPAALQKWKEELREEVAYEAFVQFKFFEQWEALKHYANEQGVVIVGDLPIFVAQDSADVWAHQDLFALKEDGRPQAVAGVPPDYFAKTGQLWGNPLYRWDRMKQNGYSWWAERFRGALELFDHIRLDHFRGFESYWEVSGDATVATHGRWAPGPRDDLFRQVEKRLGKMPIIAEDLGMITPEVDALREGLGLPGMRVLQFAFGDDPKAHDYLPHNYPQHCVCYTGTHDNDTTVGWFRSEAGEGTTRAQEAIDTERAFALKYLRSDGSEINWDLIRLALSSVAEMAVFPLQDLFGLGSEGRMNTPGTASGNWGWRFQWKLLTPAIEERLADLTRLYDRQPVRQRIVAEGITS